MSSYDTLHPCREIERLMKVHGYNNNRAAFSRLLNISESRLSKVLQGKTVVTEDLALRLSFVFKEHTASDWMMRQVAYNLAQAKDKGLVEKIANEIGSGLKKERSYLSGLEMNLNSRMGNAMRMATQSV